MKKALGILFIFGIKCILGDGNVQKTDPIFHSNLTSRYMQADTNPLFFHSRPARDADDNCSTCGKLGGERIVHGPVVNPTDKYPWMVYIRARKRAGENEIFCGGALINEYFVITAAHCTVDKKSLNAPAEHFLKIKVFFVLGSCRKVSQGPEVERAYPHPKYDGSFAHDISLIKLRSKAKCSKHVKPICLPNAEGKRITFKGQDVSASGWGSGNENKFLSIQEADPGSINPGRDLREARMTIGTAQDCRKNSPIYASPRPYLLCVIPDQKQFTCSGDSGSPLVLKYKERLFLVGVHSGRKGRTCSKAPKVANSVPHHMKWIQRVTGLRPDYPVARDGTKFT